MSNNTKGETYTSGLFTSDCFLVLPFNERVCVRRLTCVFVKRRRVSGHSVTHLLQVGCFSFSACGLAGVMLSRSVSPDTFCLQETLRAFLLHHVSQLQTATV